MKKNVTIINSGSSNLLNVSHAFEYCGGNVSITTNPNDIKHADYLVLPGVGTFGYCMDILHRHSLIEAIIQHSEASKPLIGICVGMQVLLENGFEFGEFKGLGLIPGNVKRISDAYDNLGKKNKIPHIGWFKLFQAPFYDSSSTNILLPFSDESYAYFQHSYCAELKNPAHLAAYYQNNHLQIPALVQKGNIYGSQFHLEKSGKFGLDIIKNFYSV